MAKAAVCLTTNPVITVSDIDTTVNCEPRVLDTRLAEALGFVQVHSIRKLIRQHEQTLRSFGEVFSVQKKPSARGGRPGTDYYLNKRQALFITAKSDTERAAMVTVQMVEVFDAVTRGAVGEMVSVDQRGMAVFRIGGRLVMADTNRWQIENERAVVMTHDGRLSVQRATCDRSERSPWMGARFGRGPWKKPRPGHPAASERCGLWIIGAAIDTARATPRIH